MILTRACLFHLDHFTVTYTQTSTEWEIHNTLFITHL